MPTALEVFNKAKVDYDAAWETMRRVGRNAFKEVAETVFDAYPAVKSFSWQQYTPYYNDGDPCVFRVRTGYDTILINGGNYDGDEEPDDWDDDDVFDGEKYASGKEHGEKFDEAFKEVERVLELFPEEMLEELFGDHAQISIYRDGDVTVDRYEHD